MNLKGKRYATQKDMEKLADVVNKLAERLVELSAWQTYHILKDMPYEIPSEMRKEILAKNQGLLRMLYENLFRTHPLLFPVSVDCQKTKEASK